MPVAPPLLIDIELLLKATKTFKSPADLFNAIIQRAIDEQHYTEDPILHAQWGRIERWARKMEKECR